MSRPRARDLGIRIGKLPTGPQNAITDVPETLVGHRTLIFDQPSVARTGVTIILPRADKSRDDHAFAGFHSFNGNGEMTGLLWLDESGLLGSPIALTNTNQVGIVREALIEYDVSVHGGRGFRLSVVAETWDGWLNEIDAFHLEKQHVFDAIAAANDGPVAEGNVGGGTGMICHDFKGGIGTASRLVSCHDHTFTVGVLVQTNYGDRADLRVDGVPVGLELGAEQIPVPKLIQPGGSIIVIIGTDAPLLPMQCRRLAQRATVGLARVGGYGYNTSGDIFLAYATGNHILAEQDRVMAVHMVPNSGLDVFFAAVAEATEEAILNALLAAETMTGYLGRQAHALPADDLLAVMRKYRRLT
ncbi:MAG: P1 family peptidase [Anaerolineales bacterium]|nr:P1 family peptidase [Anaerolineales bacterium]